MRRMWVWLALALVMWGSRRKDLRRAALRGVVAMGVAKALALLPPNRGRWGDEAAVGAFVAGVAIHVPVAAPPLGLVAVATAERGSGHAGGRLVAATFGTAVAGVTTRVWPVPPSLGPQAPKVFLPKHAEPNEDGAGLTVVVNADSGPDNQESPAREIKRALPKATVVEVTIERGDELRKALDDAVNEGAIALGVSGGDGSINTAAQVALDEKKALMVVPGGTLNHLTEALGIESVADSLEAVRKGEVVGMDVATIAGKAFLNTASFGAYVELVDAREKLEGKIGKWPAVLVALVRVLRHCDPLDVEIEGERHKIWMAFIGNCRYHPSGFAPTWRERLDDELLDFRYVTGNQPMARTRLILAVMTGRLGQSKVYQQTAVKRLHLRSLEGPLRLARDGETFDGPEEIIIEKLPHRLAVYVPHDKKP